MRNKKRRQRLRIGLFKTDSIHVPGAECRRALDFRGSTLLAETAAEHHILLAEGSRSEELFLQVQTPKNNKLWMRCAPNQLGTQQRGPFAPKRHSSLTVCWVLWTKNTGNKQFCTLILSISIFSRGRAMPFDMSLPKHISWSSSVAGSFPEPFRPSASPSRGPAPMPRDLPLSWKMRNLTGSDPTPADLCFTRPKQEEPVAHGKPHETRQVGRKKKTSPSLQSRNPNPAKMKTRVIGG